MITTHKIVMLPTEKASNNVGDIVLCPTTNRLAILNCLTNESTQPSINQHLYILSDEEIKEGDYFYNPATKEILHASHDMLSWNNDTTQEHKGWKKVIATTDKSLIRTLEEWEQIGIAPKGYNQLPQIPESFLPIFVKAYNEGNPITEVELEYETYFDGYATQKDYNLHNPKFSKQLKPTSNNEVIISLPEVKMYSGKEVALQGKRFMYSLIQEMYSLSDEEFKELKKYKSYNKADEMYNKWIEENL